MCSLRGNIPAVTNLKGFVSRSSLSSDMIAGGFGMSGGELCGCKCYEAVVSSVREVVPSSLNGKDTKPETDNILQIL